MNISRITHNTPTITAPKNSGALGMMGLSMASLSDGMTQAADLLGVLLGPDPGETIQRSGSNGDSNADGDMSEFAKLHRSAWDAAITPSDHQRSKKNSDDDDEDGSDENSFSSPVTDQINLQLVGVVQPQTQTSKTDPVFKSTEVSLSNSQLALDDAKNIIRSVEKILGDRDLQALNAGRSVTIYFENSAPVTSINLQGDVKDGPINMTLTAKSEWQDNLVEKLPELVQWMSQTNPEIKIEISGEAVSDQSFMGFQQQQQQQQDSSGRRHSSSHITSDDLLKEIDRVQQAGI